MKNLLLIISVFFLYIQTINAQYLPLVKENAKWSGISSSGYGGESWESGYYNIIKGDTLVNGLDYKKVFQKFTWYETTYWTNGTITSVQSGNYNNPEELIGVIREDTTARKVYFVSLSENLPCLFDGSAGILPINEEFLLYDFDVNIEVGDTLDIGPESVSMYFPTVVYNIYTVEYSDGIVRKAYSMNGPTSYVEGVGGYNGLFGSVDFGQEALAVICYLNCFSDNDNYLIGDGYYPCDSLAEIVDNVNDLNQVNWTANVSPNPFHNNIKVEINSPDFQTINIKVIDLLGHEVFNQKLSLSNQTIEIPTENWESGFYTIILTNELSDQRVFKVMKY